MRSSIAALESDINIIQSEQEVQTRSLLKRKDTLDVIVSDIAQLRLMGKGAIPRGPRADIKSRRTVAAKARTDSEAAGSGSADGAASPRGLARAASGEATDVDVDADADGEADLEDGNVTDNGVQTSLDPNATPSSPRTDGMLAAPVQQPRPRHRQHLLVSGQRDTPTSSRDVSPAVSPQTPNDADAGASTDVHMHGESENESNDSGRNEEGEEGEEGEEMEDIEVGEVSERNPRGYSRGKKVYAEDREEGEASDESSVLSDPPDI